MTPSTNVDFTYPTAFKEELFRAVPEYEIDLAVLYGDFGKLPIERNFGVTEMTVLAEWGFFRSYSLVPANRRDWLPLSPALTIRQQFENWRKTQGHRSRIPETLWGSAVIGFSPK